MNHAPIGTQQPGPRLGRALRWLPVWIAVALLAFLVAGGWQQASSAEGPPKVSIRYISVTGEGPSAKAWYGGAEPSGTTVQDALDTFAKQGYRVARLSDAYPVSTANPAWILILERVEK